MATTVTASPPKATRFVSSYPLATAACADYTYLPLQSRPLSTDALFSMFKNGSASQNGNDDEHKEKDKEKEAAKVGQLSGGLHKLRPGLIVSRNPDR